MNLSQNESESSKLKILRKKLPIWSVRDKICNALQQNDVLLLKGDTGSGKSTQVPQLLSTMPWCQQQRVNIEDINGLKDKCLVGGIIAITQPRRVAAITLAQRVSQEMGSSLQNKNSRNTGLVGYSVRFDKLLPKGMKIKFVTEGTLLQEMLQDQNLKQYSAIVVDEIHERSVDVDLIVGFLKLIVHGDKRGRGGVPLKVVIMSATLDLKGIETFFALPRTHDRLNPELNHSSIMNLHSHEAGKRKEIRSEDSKKSSNEFNTSSHNLGDLNCMNNSKVEPPSSGSNSIPSKEEITESQFSKSLTDSVAKREKVTNSLENVSFNNGVSVLSVEGRQFNVNIIHETKPTLNYMDRMLQLILEIHVKEPLPGDILAFLTGQEEIENLHAELENYSQQLIKTLPRMKILPLHGSLSAQAQQEVFERISKKFTRKVVLATNIAETSVTVPGIRYVVDCGKSKIKQYRPQLGLESLLAKPISRVSAIQRAGRAGRETEGKCFRLYTESDYNKLNENELPEILRSNIAEAILKMKARGIKDVLAFPLMDTPNIVSMEKALIRLHIMGVLNDDGEITDCGKKIARLPLPAPYGRVLISGQESEPNLILDLIDIVSCLTTDSEIFLQPKSEEERNTIEEFRKEIHHREGDIITLLQTVQHYIAEATNHKEWCNKRMISIRAMNMVMQIRKQLRQICYVEKILKEKPLPDPRPITPISPDCVKVILKIFLKAFSTNTAILAPNGCYTTTQGKNPITIHPSSVLYGQKVQAIMFLDHIFTAKNYARRVSVIEAPWILEVLGI